eukprot:6490885-Amphidinium_carterae.1
MRGLPFTHLRPFLEELDDACLAQLCELCRVPDVSALQARIARLPVAFGGLGLPSLEKLAPLVRAASLYRARRDTPWHAAQLTSLVEAEQAELRDQLVPNVAAMPQLLNLDARPPAVAAKYLLRQMRLLTNETLRREMREYLGVMQDDVAIAFELSTSREAGGTEAVVKTGQWLNAWPTTSSLTLSNTEVEHGLRQRLGLPHQPQGTVCRYAPQTTHRTCQAILDPRGCHAARCNKSGVIRRHNAIRDLIRDYACKAGLQARVEPRLLAERNAQPRDKQQADVHIQRANGAAIWIDVRVCTYQRGGLSAFLQAQETEKCQEYRQTVPLPGTLHSGVIPCVLERYGLAAPCAFQFLTWLQQQRAIHLHRQGRHWAQAAALATTELWQP